MDLLQDFESAVKKTVSRFLNAKTDDPMYVFPTKVAGRTLFAVLSAKECEANRINPAKSIDKTGATDGGLKEFKHHYHKSVGDPKFQAQLQFLRGVREQVRAQEKLKKMERGEKSPERPTELATTEA